MSERTLRVGFIPLVDCAPLIIARELGFAEQEGIDIELSREASWSALRDKLALGKLDAAHMLAPVPLAMSMGLGGMPAPLDALMVLSVNGNVIGVSPAFAKKLRDAGASQDFSSAEAIGRTLINVTDRRLTVGVPFPFSMHTELLCYWLGSLGLRVPEELDLKTIPPPNMAEAMASGDIDAFCVGEPYGSMAVERGVAELILPTNAIWEFSVEKVLAVRRGWPEESPERCAALMRAVWHAAHWLSNRENLIGASVILAGRDYVGVSSDIIDRALTGNMKVNAQGEERRTARFLELFDGLATFPWRSQAVWIATRLAARMGGDRVEAAAVARACFRADLYRRHLGPIGASLPGASEKLEGSLNEPLIIGAQGRDVAIGPDRFFDGQVFDPLKIK